MKLYCSYDQTRYSIGGLDHESSWSRDSTEGDYWVTGVYLTGGFRDEVYSPDEAIEEGDVVYVAYVVFGDGDTFGHDGGYSTLLVASKDKAIAEAAQTWAKEVQGFGYCEEPWAEPHTLYPGWTGYFNWVQDIRIFEGMVGA